jgi:hypothetical protein
VWARDDVKKLHRVSVRTVPGDRLPSPAVVVLSRLVITGGNHHRLHEELTEAGGYLREDGFRREERVTEVRSWLDESVPAALSDGTFAALRARFERNRDATLSAVHARSRDRLRTLANTLDTRKTREMEDIRQVLDDLERALRDELAREEEPKQLTLFTDDERTQLARDRAALEVRLARIPDEREQEVSGIEARYAGLTDRTFPVAVVLLVPAFLTDGGARL